MKKSKFKMPRKYSQPGWVLLDSGSTIHVGDELRLPNGRWIVTSCVGFKTGMFSHYRRWRK